MGPISRFSVENSSATLAWESSSAKVARAVNGRPWGPRMDTLTTIERSERMSRIRGKDTRVELRVRRIVHALGYRYRLHDRDLPGNPDLVFKGRRKVIFVHGCFWHRHPDPECKLARMPKSRLDFWDPKLSSNRERDQRAEARLREMGWQSLVVWECESRHIEQLENMITAFLDGREEAHHACH